MKRVTFKQVIGLALVCCVISACRSLNADMQRDLGVFLDNYTQTYQKLYTASSEAQWMSNIEIKEGDSTHAVETRRAGEAMAAFTGSDSVIQKARYFLKFKDELTPVQIKQLDFILYSAANNPASVDSIVKARIKAETAQTETLFGFPFKLNGKAVSTNDIDGILKSELNLEKRLQAWESSKEVGIPLKPGLMQLRDLRNKTVQALGYEDYFQYQVSEYGLSTDEMLDLNRQILNDLWPLYRELHTFMRYTLAKKYGVQQVPDYLPAHWLPNRWGQDWSSEVQVEGINLDSILATKGPEWITQQAEAFYVSIGFDTLPKVFWQKSSLFPYKADSVIKKNNHASAWHMDLDKDVRSLMSVEANTEWWETANHELGHIYYYMSYSHPGVPLLLRGGANRAYHEAMGSLMGLAAMQKPFLEKASLIKMGNNTDNQVQSLLKEALNTVVFMPFSAGTMTAFEKQLYADSLNPGQWNKVWWSLAKKYQGIVPPADRGELGCDAATKTHINDDAAQYYDYALSYAILYQMHQHIAGEILRQDPRNCNYFGNRKIGEFLKSIMIHGASKDWRSMMRETTGDTLNAKAMVAYFSPLLTSLKQENKGRTCTLPEKI